MRPALGTRFVDASATVAVFGGSSSDERRLPSEGASPSDTVRKPPSEGTSLRRGEPGHLSSPP